MRLVPKRTDENWMGDPFGGLENLHHEMNRLFNFSFCPQEENEGPFPAMSWAPAIDVLDAKDSLTIKADLPGLKKEEIDVSVEDNRLTIKGEKKREAEYKEEGCVRSERFYGSFYRSVMLPSGVDTAKAQASFKDGVLELTLPKKEEAKLKQIRVDVK